MRARWVLLWSVVSHKANALHNHSSVQGSQSRSPPLMWFPPFLFPDEYSRWDQAVNMFSFVLQRFSMMVSVALTIPRCTPTDMSSITPVTSNPMTAGVSISARKANTHPSLAALREPSSTTSASPATPPRTWPDGKCRTKSFKSYLDTI